jgi:hypothetical protein
MLFHEEVLIDALFTRIVTGRPVSDHNNSKVKSLIKDTMKEWSR